MDTGAGSRQRSQQGTVSSQPTSRCLEELVQLLLHLHGAGAWLGGRLHQGIGPLAGAFEHMLEDGQSGSFQALGDGIYSTIVSLCRQLVVLLPAAYLLSLTGQVQRVWLAFPIAEVVSGTVTFICFTRIYRQKIRPLFHVL